MIRVTHETIIPEQVKRETLRFLELDVYFLGYRVHLAMPKDLTEEEAEILEVRATKRMNQLFEKTVNF